MNIRSTINASSAPIQSSARALVTSSSRKIKSDADQQELESFTKTSLTDSRTQGFKNSITASVAAGVAAGAVAAIGSSIPVVDKGAQVLLGLMAAPVGIAATLGTFTVLGGLLGAGDDHGIHGVAGSIVPLGTVAGTVGLVTGLLNSGANPLTVGALTGLGAAGLMAGATYPYGS